MKNAEILKRLAKVRLNPKKVNNEWILELPNKKTLKSSNLAGLVGIPSFDAKELLFLCSK